MEFTVYTAILPIVIALGEAYKASTKSLNVRFRDLMVPTFCILSGVIISMLAYGFSGNVALNGLATGLTAMGLYSGSMSTYRVVKRAKPVQTVKADTENK